MQTYKPATAANRFRSLQQLFKWLEEEGEVTTSKPHAPAQGARGARPRPRRRRPTPPAGHLRGKEYEQRRDTAIIALFLDTGMRLDELASLKLDDLDLDQDVAIVMGKGRRSSSCPFGRKTAAHLDRYLRARRSHKAVTEPWLWLGKKGRMTTSGIGQMIGRRGSKQASRDCSPTCCATDSPTHGAFCL